MPLFNCKIHLEFNWTKDCVMSNIAGETIFKITNTELHVPIVTLSFNVNVNLTIKCKTIKQLNAGVKEPVYWNEYIKKIESKIIAILQDFILMLLFKGLKEDLFFLLTILLMVLKKLKQL